MAFTAVFLLTLLTGVNCVLAEDALPRVVVLATGGAPSPAPTRSRARSHRQAIGRGGPRVKKACSDLAGTTRMTQRIEALISVKLQATDQM